MREPSSQIHKCESQEFQISTDYKTCFCHCDFQIMLQGCLLFHRCKPLVLLPPRTREASTLGTLLDSFPMRFILKKNGRVGFALVLCVVLLCVVCFDFFCWFLSVLY